MQAELIDIQIIDDGYDVEISLSGSLSKAQLSSVKEKLNSIMNSSGCFFFLNLENVHFVIPDYLDVFLDLLNNVKGRNSLLILIFKKEEMNQYFSKYKNVFEIYDSREAYRNSGLTKQLKQVGIYYEKTTGLALSPSVAIVVSLLVLGWLVTLFLIIVAQGKEIASKQAKIVSLQGQKDRYIQEIHKLESSIGPLKRLGVVEDTSRLKEFGNIKDWVSYLYYLESNSHGK